jgi:hypothetical protein
MARSTGDRIEAARSGGATGMVTVLRGAHHQCPLDQQMQLLCSALWTAMAHGLEFPNEECAKAPPETARMRALLG